MADDGHKCLMADIQLSLLIASLGVIFECPESFDRHPNLVSGHFFNSCWFDELRDTLECFSGVLEGGFDPFHIFATDEGGFHPKQSVRFLEVPLDVVCSVEDVGCLLICGLNLIQDFKDFEGSTHTGRERS